MSRTLNQQDNAELIGYFHLARTALAAQKTVPSRYDRLVWAAKTFARKHPDIPEVRAYKRVDELTRR